MGSLSPSDAVDLDEDSAAEQLTDDHAAAEGADVSESTGIGTRKTLEEMALSTEPSVPLEHVESPWDPDRGGPTRILRAVQKATGVDALPAIGDLVLGVLETLSSIEAEDEDAGSDDDTGGLEEGDPIV